MLTNGMSRAIAVVLGLTLAVATLISVSAQGGPPHYYYGTGATAGDTIALHADGAMVESATVDANGGWSIQADVDPADASFTVNGEAATADIASAGEGASEVSLTVAASEDAMGEDSMGEDAMGEGEESMGEDAMGEDAMGEGEELSLDEDSNGFPDTGSGGLADSGGISAGLIGLLIALGAVAVTGLSLRRVRNRA